MTTFRGSSVVLVPIAQVRDWRRFLAGCERAVSGLARSSTSLASLRLIVEHQAVRCSLDVSMQAGGDEGDPIRFEVRV